MELLKGQTRLEIIPGASDLFEEAGALEQVARLARDWLASATSASTGSRMSTPPSCASCSCSPNRNATYSWSATTTRPSMPGALRTSSRQVT